MTARIAAAGYLGLFALFVGLRAWSLPMWVDSLALGAYLLLCRRYGLAALAPAGCPHGRASTLLALIPSLGLVSAYVLAFPWPFVPPLLALLALCYGVARRTTRAWNGWRKLDGLALLATPPFLFALTAWGFRGEAGGVMMTLLGWLDFSFGYAGSGVPHLVPAAALAAVLVLALSWRVSKGDALASLAASLLSVYAIGAYLLFVTYYHLPLDHTLEDVVAQPATRLLPSGPKRGPGRTLHVGRDEKMLYLAVKSTQISDGSEALSGVLSYDVERGREAHFFEITAPCIAMVVDEASGILHTCDFFQRRILQLELATLLPNGVEQQLDGSSRPEELVRLDDRHLLVRFEIPGRGPDLARLDLQTRELAPIRVPRPPLVAGCYGVALDRARRKIFAPTVGDDRILLNRLAWDGSFEGSVSMRGFTFEALYSRHHDSVFVATLNRNVLYRIDPETLALSQTEIPNGIRALREGPDGLLIIGDYIRGKVYLYDPDSERIVHTLLVGRKPQAIALAPGSGHLYAHSSFGIAVFDLPEILRRLRAESL